MFWAASARASAIWTTPETARALASPAIMVRRVRSGRMPKWLGIFVIRFWLLISDGG